MHGGDENEEELGTWLDALLAGAGAAAGCVTLHAGGSDVLVRRAGAELGDAAWRQVTQLAAGTDRRASAAAPDMVGVLLDGRAWRLLRVPAATGHGGRAVASLLLGPTSAGGDQGGPGCLFPLIQQGLRSWARLRALTAEAAGLGAALDALDFGVMLIDGAARVTSVNRAAAALLADGAHLRRMGGGLAAAELGDAVALQVAVHDAVAANADRGRMRARRAPVVALRSARADQADHRLILAVIPCEQPAVEPGETAAIVYALDPRAGGAEQLAPVCRLYGLSPVETRLVTLLTAGTSLNEAAGQMRIKEQTARSYLKLVFLKTGTKRQADLVRVMLCSLLRTGGELPLEVVEGR